MSATFPVPADLWASPMSLRNSDLGPFFGEDVHEMTF